MAKLSLDVLKEKFETGDMPTGTDFVNLIDTLADATLVLDEVTARTNADSNHLTDFSHADIAHSNRSALDLVSGTNTGDYTHPDNHPPAIITQDSSNRFVTDTEKSAWNAKADDSAMTTALGGKLDVGLKGDPNGLATLDENGKLTATEIPEISITDTFVVATEVAMLALTCQRGDVAVRSDVNQTFILKGNSPSTLSDWQQLPIPTVPVLSVNGKTGALTLDPSDIGTNGVATLDSLGFVTSAQLPASVTGQQATAASLYLNANYGGF